jgi:hypothetical protein
MGNKKSHLCLWQAADEFIKNASHSIYHLLPAALALKIYFDNRVLSSRKQWDGTKISELSWM